MDGKSPSTAGASTALRPSVTRRGMIGAGLGAAAAGLTASLGAPRVWAKSYPTLGTYPAGVRGKSVFVGGLAPLTGDAADYGEDMRKGLTLAIEHLNNGSRVTEAVPTLRKGGGVLGKTIEFSITDTETSPNPAVQAASGFIDDKKAILLVGGVSSSVDVALEKLAQRKKVVHLIPVSGSDAPTGKDCERFSFRMQPRADMAAKALIPVLAQHLGKNLKAAYLVPDYVFGHQWYAELSKIAAEQGWKTITKQVVPLGATDFSSYLLNIANSGADIFINAEGGVGTITSTKQAAQFGITKKMKYVIPLLSVFLAKGLGPDVLGGLYGYQPWWWSEENTNPLAKYFVEDFQKRFHYRPRWAASAAYNQMVVWADAVERAGTFYPGEVVKALESGHPVDTIYGKVWYRAGDHQGVQGVPVFIGKTKAEMKNPDDYYRLVEMVPGQKVLPPLSETGCHMPSLSAA